MVDLNAVLGKLAKVSRPDAQGRYMALCPFHTDKGESLRVFPNGSARCFGACDRRWSPKEFAEALELAWDDGRVAREPVYYDYHDPQGNLVYQSVRVPLPPPKNKRFYQRRPNPQRPNEWITNMTNVKRYLYRLPQILGADPEQWVYVVEGEKDADRLARLGLTATCNVSGAGKWRPGYNRYLEGRRVAILPDNDEPGQNHAEAVASALLPVAREVRIVRLPGLPPKGDVSDWLNAGHEVQELQELVEGAPPYLLGDLSASNGHGNSHAPEEDLEDTRVVWEGSKHRSVSQHLIRQGLKSRGTFIATQGSQFYYFDQETKGLHEIESFSLQALLNDAYEVNAKESLYSYLIEDMRVEAAMRGTRAMIHQFAYYDEGPNRLYLDMGSGRMLRLDGQRIEEMDNGTDGVLFLPMEQAEPWRYLPDAPEHAFYNTLVRQANFADAADAPHSLDELRILAMLWLLCLPFESVQPTKPLALAIGPPSAGKSSWVRMIGMALVGSGFQVTTVSKDGEKDFWTKVTNSRFAAFDNVDQYVPWLEEALATISTGASRTMRELFTTNRAVTVNVRIFLGLTAHSPRFRRTDVSQRLLLFPFAERRDEDGFRAERDLHREVLDQRDAILSDYARLVNRVVAAPPQSPQPKVLRLADFAAVAERIGEGLGIAERVQTVLAKLKRSQQIYASEEHPLYLAIDQWLDQRPPQGRQMDLEAAQQDGATNEGRRVHTRQLYQELRGVAEDLGLKWSFPGAQSLGRQLQLLAPALAIHFEVDRGQDARGSWWWFQRRRPSEGDSSKSSE